METQLLRMREQICHFRILNFSRKVMQDVSVVSPQCLGLSHPSSLARQNMIDSLLLQCLSGSCNVLSIFRRPQFIKRCRYWKDAEEKGKTFLLLIQNHKIKFFLDQRSLEFV